MSTRATYKFEGKDQREATTIYIHHDGYESGAATYFWNLMHVSNAKGDLATQFIRANDNAEITTSHDAHGDTEFRYTFKGEHLTAQKRVSWDAGVLQWKTFFTGDYHDFVNQYGADGFMENFEEVKKVKVGYGERWVTETMLVKMVENKQSELESYKARFPMFVGNISGMEKDVETLKSSLKDNFDTEIEIDDFSDLYGSEVMSILHQTI